MSGLIKKKARIKSKPSDYTFVEAESLLISIGFVKKEGKGSRVKFFRNADNAYISFDKPHGNSSVLKKYIVNIIVNVLKDKGDL